MDFFSSPNLYFSYSLKNVPSFRERKNTAQLYNQGLAKGHGETDRVQFSGDGDDKQPSTPTDEGSSKKSVPQTQALILHPNPRIQRINNDPRHSLLAQARRLSVLQKAVTLITQEKAGKINLPKGQSPFKTSASAPKQRKLPAGVSLITMNYDHDNNAEVKDYARTIKSDLENYHVALPFMESTFFTKRVLSALSTQLNRPLFVLDAQVLATPPSDTHESSSDSESNVRRRTPRKNPNVSHLPSLFDSINNKLRDFRATAKETVPQETVHEGQSPKSITSPLYIVINNLQGVSPQAFQKMLDQSKLKQDCKFIIMSDNTSGMANWNDELAKSKHFGLPFVELDLSPTDRAGLIKQSKEFQKLEDDMRLHMPIESMEEFMEEFFKRHTPPKPPEGMFFIMPPSRHSFSDEELIKHLEEFFKHIKKKPSVRKDFKANEGYHQVTYEISPAQVERYFEHLYEKEESKETKKPTEFTIPFQDAPLLRKLHGPGTHRLKELCEETAYNLSNDTTRSFVAQLFNGTTGTGKTFGIRALAKAIQARTKKPTVLMAATGNDLGVKKYVGTGSEAVKRFFNAIKEQKEKLANAGGGTLIVFIDELDSVSSRTNDRNRASTETINEILTAMDGIDPTLKAGPKEGQGKVQVIMLAGTNLKDNIDPAVLRRFGQPEEYKQATRREIRQILGYHLNAQPKALIIDQETSQDIRNRFQHEESAPAKIGEFAQNLYAAASREDERQKTQETKRQQEVQALQTQRQTLQKEITMLETSSPNTQNLSAVPEDISQQIADKKRALEKVERDLSFATMPKKGRLERRLADIEEKLKPLEQPEVKLKPSEQTLRSRLREGKKETKAALAHLRKDFFVKIATRKTKLKDTSIVVPNALVSDELKKFKGDPNEVSMMRQYF